MSIIQSTDTGSNFLQKIATDGDSGVQSLVNLYEKYTSGAAQTVFTLTGTYVPGSETLLVFINGQKAEAVVSASDATEYEETSSNTVTFGSGLLAGDIVEFIMFGTVVGLAPSNHRIVTKPTSGNIYPEDLKGNTTIVNDGATALVVLNLPAGKSGDKISFMITDTDGIQVVANGTETFRHVATVGGAGGNTNSTTLGSTWTIRFNAGTSQWIVSDVEGTVNVV